MLSAKLTIVCEASYFIARRPSKSKNNYSLVILKSLLQVTVHCVTSNLSDQIIIKLYFEIEIKEDNPIG